MMRSVLTKVGLMVSLLGVIGTSQAMDGPPQSCPSVEEVAAMGNKFEKPLAGGAPGFWRAAPYTAVSGTVERFSRASALGVYRGIHFQGCAYTTDQNENVDILYQPEKPFDGSIVKIGRGNKNWTAEETQWGPLFTCSADDPAKCTFTPAEKDWRDAYQ
ncbi:hypothetical protein PAQ31011_03519 [Pandoraea aquatica]|uniref:DUF3757 domain-containing protein n=1 Tax=Pandoraea aquatica TaxID=2508290 RepID=A0A5E4WTD4_9BURK|nr:DUF3757 domain-containing protein [Pandoraea aquatica]VVE28098.1 hypothetical protein PAQ31011_03519 [Pandoraea aquatica]